MKPFPEHIFRSYDIRGIYPEDLNEEIAYKIAKAFVKTVKPKKVVIGRDMRKYSEKLTQCVIDIFLSAGVDVDDIGLVPVDTFYYACGKYQYDGGIYTTASHNPKEYHGFKMTKGGLVGLRGTDIKDLVKSGDLELPQGRGQYKKMDIMDEFIAFMLSFVDARKIRPMKVVVDAGNGMAGKSIPLIAKHLPITITELFFELDGNFPNHPSDPFHEQSLIALSQEVVSKKADFGVIFDGDSDRIFFVDEKGQFVRADITLLILAKYFLSRNPQSKIVYNAICTRAVREFVQKWGGVPIRCKVGAVNVREAIQENQALFGGELSGHYAYRDNYFSDSGNLTFLVILQLVSEDKRKFSEIVKELMVYSKSQEINLPIKNIPEKINLVKDRYRDGKQDFLDGITVEYEDWWFNVRPSNTEPLLRIIIEAKNDALLFKKKEELLALITGKT